jgi:hypothetical protein
MNGNLSTEAARSLVVKRFGDEKILIDSIVVREYPEETVFVVHVRRDCVADAAGVGNDLDSELQEKGYRGFVTVRATAPTKSTTGVFSRKAGVSDSHATALLGLLTERARTSESQPSLEYVRDAAENLTKVMAGRHSLIFGRRGAGKTALMLEARKQILAAGNVVVWLNLQTYRTETLGRATLWVLAKVVDALLTRVQDDTRQAVLMADMSRLRADVEGLLGEPEAQQNHIIRLLPRVQRALRRYCDSSATRIYVFLDDFHYLSRASQPDLLDHLHACVRDVDAWLKVAAVRHFARWYRNDPPTGLQAGQDAVSIDLDLTLQEPGKAKKFLESVLAGFARHVDIPRISSLYANHALDRLLLASGAVPRDYLVLAANAISYARERTGARRAGKQDVTRAAGDIAKTKIAELEDDTSSESGTNDKLLLALELLRDFCLSERKHTVFQVDFKDKERHAAEYGLLQGLMDLRLIHIANASVSDTHRSGTRSEAYVLDLSQYSGERLKKRLHALDFEDGYMVLKLTGTTQAPRIGDTPRKLLTILRSSPRFDLTKLSTIATGA